MPISQKKSRAVQRFLRKKVRQKNRSLSQKTENTSSKSAGPAYTFSTELPEQYNDTFMRAIPKDPEWIYVYWELPEKTPSIQTTSGKKYVTQNDLLHLRETVPETEEKKPVKPLEIPTVPRSKMYVRMPQGAKRYSIEYGVKTETGTFSPAVSAPVVSIPQPGIKPPAAVKTDVDTDKLTELSYDNIDISRPGVSGSLPSSPHNSSSFIIGNR
ncbi:MAG: DUF4912 domain-containing protein [Chitinispirillaceae bacterium]